VKEASECEYWTSLLKDTGYIATEIAGELIRDNQEIIRMLISTIKTSKNL
jgi:four helix bundle protein